MHIGSTFTRVLELLETRRLYAAGDFDTTFAGSGVLTHSFGITQEATDSVVQADGKIVVVGNTVQVGGQPRESFVARYLADGKPDSTFGTAGVKVFSWGPTIEETATCVALQADGKILIGGWHEEAPGTGLGSFGIFRMSDTGVPDSGFGFSGFVSIDFSGGVDAPSGIAVDGSGMIWVVGTTAYTSGVGIAMTRLEPVHGSIDGTFNEPGIPSGRVTDVPAAASGIGYAAGRVTFDSAGRPIVAITKFSASITAGGISVTGADMGVARYLTTGQPDTTFGDNGKAFVGFNRTFEFGTGVDIDDRTGKIVLSGTTANGTTSFGAVLAQGLGTFKAATRANYGFARFTASGAPDDKFSGDGKLQVDFGEFLLDGCSDVVCDSEGRLTASGGTQIRKQAADFSVCRITPGGAIDPTFNADGLRIIDLGGGEGSFGSTIQSNDRVLLFGVKFVNATRSRVAVIQLLEE